MSYCFSQRQTNITLDQNVREYDIKFWSMMKDFDDKDRELVNQSTF